MQTSRGARGGAGEEVGGGEDGAVGAEEGGRVAVFAEGEEGEGGEDGGGEGEGEVEVGGGHGGERCVVGCECGCWRGGWVDGWMDGCLMLRGERSGGGSRSFCSVEGCSLNCNGCGARVFGRNVRFLKGAVTIEIAIVPTRKDGAIRSVWKKCANRIDASSIRMLSAGGV